MITTNLSAQNLFAGFGWGLLNFNNNVIDKSSFNLLSYKVKGDSKYSLMIKYMIPDKPLRFKGGYYHSEITGNGQIININPSANTADLDVRVENNLTTMMLGLEYLFETEDLKPFVGVDIIFGFFGESDVYFSDNLGNTEREIFSSKTRIGLGISSGVSYVLFPGIEVDINFVYSSLNFLGKEDYEDNIITTDLGVNLFFIL